MARTPWYRTDKFPRSIQITRGSFEKIHQLIEDAEGSAVRVRMGTDLMVRYMALTVKGFAQVKSAGPLAAGRRSNPALAFKIPVQRITGRYYGGWQIRRYGSGRWMIFNEDRAAVIVEFGIFRGKRRVRRPILKMATISMLRFVSTTRVGDQFASTLLRPRRDAQGRWQSFEARMKESSILGVSGPSGSLP